MWFDVVLVGQWEKYQVSEKDLGKYGEVVVDLVGEVFVDQVEGECLEDGDEQQIMYGLGIRMGC